MPQYFKKFLSKFRKEYFGLAGINFDKEVEPFIGELKGLVLNAGSGLRPLKIDLAAILTDIDENAPVDFLSDLHYIPLRDECVDSIITIAVLEHTQYPWVVISELARILKPGGTMVFCVPFIQPEHAIPHDYYRYTIYGVKALLSYAGLTVKTQTRLSRYHRAIGWILNEKWKRNTGLQSYAQSFIVNQISRHQKDTELPPFSVYTGSYTIAVKPGEWKENPVIHEKKELWFKEMLVDPVTKEPLRFMNQSYFENSRGQQYTKVNGKYDLRPKEGLSQDNQRKWGEQQRTK